MVSTSEGTAVNSVAAVLVAVVVVINVSGAAVLASAVVLTTVCNVDSGAVAIVAQWYQL